MIYLPIKKKNQHSSEEDNVPTTYSLQQQVYNKNHYTCEGTGKCNT